MDNMENYWKSEWALLSVDYDSLKRENKNLKYRNTQLHKKYLDLKLKYETLMFKLQNEKEK